MSAITIGGDLVHYEKLGRGRPVILVHGWIGSWRYWIPLMQQLHTKYSVYTLDLIGFGDSAKNPSHYTVDQQVLVLEDFMDQLGIPKAAFIGHGFGAMVLVHFALKNPSKVARLLLSNLPLFDPGDLADRVPVGTRRLLTPRTDRYRLAPAIEDVDKTVPSGAEEKTIMNPAAAQHDAPTIARDSGIDRDRLRRAAEERRNNALLQLFQDKTILALLEKCFKRSEPEFDKLKADVEKSDNSVLQISAEGFNSGRMLDDLRRVTAPILAVHGDDDPVMPAPTEDIWNYLTVEKEDVFVPIPMAGVRHFPMLENDAFPRLTTDFLETADLSSLEVRERWRRRSR